MTEAQKKARNKYQKKVKKFTLDFCPSESDLLEQINKQPRKQTYIKNLIKQDIQTEKQQCQYCKLWHTIYCYYSGDDPKANDVYGCFEKKE